MYVSGWVATEVASALAMKCRMGLLDSPIEAQKQFDRLAEDSFTHVAISESCYFDAANIVRSASTGVRAADALHIATALHHRLGIATCDRILYETARLQPMPTVLVRSE